MGMDWRGRYGKRNWPEEESEEESAGRCGKKNTQSDGGKANREVSGQSEMAVFFWGYIVKLFHDMPG